MSKPNKKDYNRIEKALNDNAEYYIRACERMNTPLSDDKKALLRDFTTTRSAPIIEDFLKD